MAMAEQNLDTLTRADLAEAMHRHVGLSRAEGLQMVDEILDRMADALAAGENVKISGFGTFLLNDKGERVGRNPKTGEEAAITARRVVTFRPCQGLKQRVVDIPPK